MSRVTPVISRFTRGALCVAGALTAMSIVSAGGQRPAPPVLQDAAEDPRAAIQSALNESKKDGKFVLIDFGAGWCPDCMVLDTLLRDEIVAPFLNANFRWVVVDVGYRDKHLDVAATYRAPVAKWIPSVVVLDANGEAVAISGGGTPLVGAGSSASRITSRATANNVRYYLAQWAPKKRERTFTSFTEHGVKVTFALDRDSSGDAWLAATFDPVLADSYLYGQELPLDGINGAGQPTRFEITSTTGAKALNSTVASRPSELSRIEALKGDLIVYPKGPVTLRIPVELPARGASGRTEVAVTYMTCGPTGCLPPVKDKRVVINVPQR